MFLLRHLPNLLTLGNLSCGVLAILHICTSLNDNYYVAGYYVLLAAVFDFFDGFAARLLKVSSPIGKELDSLADMVSFGVVPGLLAYALLYNLNWDYHPIWNYTFLLIPSFSALRLAKFNLDTRQTLGFIGMPTPANAIFWSGLSFTLGSNHIVWANSVPILLFFVLGSSLLLLAELPMMALKFKDFTWRSNKLRYGFILLAVLQIVILQKHAFAPLILSYILVSLSEGVYLFFFGKK
jgi:CDP-diacylglycerol---serine O-phosphatidyltransferase